MTDMHREAFERMLFDDAWLGEGDSIDYKQPDICRMWASWQAALQYVAPPQASAAPVAWMIEWDSEDDGRKCCPRKGQDKPRLDCFPEGTTAYPLFATSQQTSAVPRRTGER